MTPILDELKKSENCIDGNEFIKASCRLYDTLTPIEKDTILKYHKHNQVNQKANFNVTLILVNSL